LESESDNRNCPESESDDGTSDSTALLHSERLSEDLWETVLPKAPHAVRSLVCLSINETPHERSPARPWLVLRSLRGYCIQAPFFYVAMFETRATPYATRLNSWRVIRRIL